MTALHLGAGDGQCVIDGGEWRAMYGQRRKLIVQSVDARTHLPQRREDAPHGTFDQRTVAADLGCKGCAARMPESIRMVEPELPASRKLKDWRSERKPRP